MHKGNKGITLVALIITIILLLILVGLTVNLVMDENLINETTDTVNTINNKAVQDNELAEEINNTWRNNPGKPIKGNTSAE